MEKLTGWGIALATGLILGSGIGNPGAGLVLGVSLEAGGKRGSADG